MRWLVRTYKSVADLTAFQGLTYTVPRCDKLHVSSVPPPPFPRMFLGIEIGGTKLQLGVGNGDGSTLIDQVRREVDPQQGASGILRHIEREGAELIRRHPVDRVGIGFGGPVDAKTGTTIRSHQISGWENVALTAWSEQLLERPTSIGNDCDVAASAEAKFGAGRGKRRVFFVTVGTGVGGGFVVDGKLDGADRPAIAEIGHLRPGLHDDRPESTVESLASGWGITSAAQARISGDVASSLDTLRRGEADEDPKTVRLHLADSRKADEEYIADLLNRCEGDPEQLTAQMVAQAAAEGNEIAGEVLGHACQALGWAVAQTITLLAPEVVVIGGGVSLIGRQLFLDPVKRAVAKYVFPPLADSYRIAPAELGELVVVQGALTLAATSVI